MVLERAARAETAEGQFSIRYQERDRPAAEMVGEGLEQAAPRLALWGQLEVPVEVDLLPDHDSLERLIRHPGYGWLRAWARYRDVLVQSPRTWSLTGGTQEQVNELLTHELTHCLMYQLSAGEEDWATKGIPLWFREGMASFTAEQGYRRGTLDALADFVAKPGADPLADAEALYQDHAEIVYNAAHHAFTYLVERYGVGRVRELMGVMKQGLSFDAAFARAIGVGRRDFERDFLERVRQRRGLTDGSSPAR